MSALKLPPRSRIGLGGFTLIELLVVIALIAVIAGLAAPALRSKSVGLEVGVNQLRDDLNRARQLAISTRSTVYVVFMPLIDPAISVTGMTEEQKRVLASRQARGYAFFARTSVGSQPGQEDLRYLSEWRSLPDDVFISTNKFAIADTFSGPNYVMPLDFIDNVPVPTSEGVVYSRLPYIAFNHQGRVQLADQGDVRKKNRREDLQERVRIPLVTGSVSAAKDVNNKKNPFLWEPANVLVKAPFFPGSNYWAKATYIKWVAVDPLTGRSRIEGGEIQ